MHLSIEDEKGNLLLDEDVDHPGNSKITVQFKLEAPEESSQWKLILATSKGETRLNNNKIDLHIRILDSKTKVLLIEGAPYWDSKFLAQMLRRQEHIQIKAIYRLSDDRYFQVSTKEHAPTTAETNFPQSQEEISSYDLIVLGKNIEPFLTPERIGLLKSFVREQGGALLFSRGKPYDGSFPALEALEPTSWSAGRIKEFRLSPSNDGESTGLFGQALPGKEDSIWRQLPALQDASEPNLLKPFSRILAEGEISGTQSRFPLLIIRRYGQGVTGVLNADGLWKWDFFPEAREKGNMYLDFWSQLLQWMASYSEFLPGQDYSLNPSQSTVFSDNNVELRIAYRGAIEPNPQIMITTPSGDPVMITPALLPEQSRPEWRATYKVTTPGQYSLRVQDPAVLTPMPQRVLNVPHPPKEQDELSSDHALLTSLSEQTGGKVLTTASWKEFLLNLEEATASNKSLAPPVWKPDLYHWGYGLLITLIFSTEWWIRRRQGLS